jgi:hypothetical protein
MHPRKAVPANRTVIRTLWRRGRVRYRPFTPLRRHKHSPSDRYIAYGDLSHLGFGRCRQYSSRTAISSARHWSVCWRLRCWNARRQRPSLAAVRLGATKDIRCRDVARRRVHAGKKPLDLRAPLKDFEQMMQMLTGFRVTQIAGDVASYSIRSAPLFADRLA